jgi:deferrochelatase/peroxidase EfeB
MGLRAPRYLAPAPSPRPAALLAAGAPALPVPVDPARTQGFVIRGYSLDFTRYLALTVRDAAKARAFIGGLVGGDQAWPRITTAQQWAPPAPNRCLQIGFTYPGLEALGLPQASLESFQGKPGNLDHYPFYKGAASRAGLVGDTGASDPANWRLSDRQFHVMLILFGATRDILDEDVALLRPGFVEGFDDPGPDRIFESQVLGEHKVYFGYRDGIAQPHIAGISYLKDPDGGQLETDPSAFMLGTGLAGATYAGPPVPIPAALGLHGCFGAFRMLEQDVEGFEAQAERLATPAFCQYAGIDPKIGAEAVKALICGRWTNGVPLSRFPVRGRSTVPDPPGFDAALNDFLFVLPDGAPDGDPAVNPDKGSNCPIGSHIRRGNMRGYPFADTTPVTHRITRRAAAYQIPYCAENRHQGERGLIGFFLGTSFIDQWEFVQRSWINNANGFAGLRDTTDPAMGTLGDAQGHFSETLGASRRDSFTFTPMSGFVTTKAGAYCFFPGIDGIAWIAAQTGA